MISDVMRLGAVRQNDVLEIGMADSAMRPVVLTITGSIIFAQVKIARNDK
jgi:hypothetical protein